MTARIGLGIVMMALCVSVTTTAQVPAEAPGKPQRPMFQDSDAIVPLSEIRMRDVCILPDAATQTYYMVGPGFNSVRIFTSKDLRTWQGSKTIYRTPEDIWGDIRVINIWAPEMHKYKDKYYLFLTFDTRNQFPEQWRGWYPRVTRGSQVLAADAPTGPFKPFANHSTLPTDMMTLDGTLWVEEGVPYMVFCHEWVQICNGTIEFIQLKDDLSQTVGEPKKMFHATAAPWPKSGEQLGNTVTDGPYLYKGKTGKLYMVWTSYGQTGYTEGIAISASGKLAGPWAHQAEPLYKDNGGHGMLFTTFDGKLMNVLHCPNDRNARPRIFEMEDTGDTLKIIKEFTEKAGISPNDLQKSSETTQSDKPSGEVAPRPLYRDPPFDAPTDPVLCFNAEANKWFMYYTARRAAATDAPGVSWVHGSNIGMAESSDGGATWSYKGTADIGYGKDQRPNDYTYWAPEVIWADGLYHMFLSYVPGIFTDWNHPRQIVHLTSKDGVKWDTIGPIDLKSDRVIDACVIQLPGGGWRMWYKDERKEKCLSCADSPDLMKWEPKGSAVTDYDGEGPKVVHWKGKYWLIADCWAQGQRVWSSDDCLNWTPQDGLLIGSHGDVVVSGDRAWWFYFGPGRRTAIQVVELSVVEGKLVPGDPAQPTYMDLKLEREQEK